MGRGGGVGGGAGGGGGGGGGGGAADAVDHVRVLVAQSFLPSLALRPDMRGPFGYTTNITKKKNEETNKAVSTLTDRCGTLILVRHKVVPVVYCWTLLGPVLPRRT